MRILQISSARALGGGERHLADLVNALHERGHEVHLALAPKSPLIEELKTLPRERTNALRLRNALDAKSAVELSRIVRQREIEIVHAHMARDYPLASFAARSSKRARLVITRHVLFPLSRIHTVTLSNVSRIIAVSQSVARALQAQNIFPANKITIIPNGIDLSRFDAKARGFKREAYLKRLQIAPERLLIGTVGEINRLKGQEDFLRAAAVVARRNAHVDFVIAGRDTSRTGEHLASLKKLVNELDLNARVHFTGWLEDVAPLLHALAIFVSASRTESFGLAIAEAMASGTPVISTATEGARELIEENTGGLIVPVGDIEALAAAMTMLIENEEERKSLAAQAYQRVSQHFSLARMVAGTEQVYEEIMRD
ncbi:MAG: glycosyltransferase family 4 protein [Pyrinomonadaceae bacterium]